MAVCEVEQTGTEAALCGSEGAGGEPSGSPSNHIFAADSNSGMLVMGLEGQSRGAAAVVAGMSFLAGGEGQEQPQGWKAGVMPLPEQTEGTQGQGGHQGAEGAAGFSQTCSSRVSGDDTA